MGDVITDRRRFADGWKGGLPETPCGAGSTMAGTVAQRAWIPTICARYGIKSIADIGAGDRNWIVRTPLNGIAYRAFDLVPRCADVVAFDLVREIPPQADLLLCLWVLNHLPFDDCRSALANLRASGAEWLMITDRPKWHHEQPPEIRFSVVEELILTPSTGDRIILARNA